jgi:hypothetical protein
MSGIGARRGGNGAKRSRDARGKDQNFTHHLAPFVVPSPARCRNNPASTNRVSLCLSYKSTCQCADVSRRDEALKVQTSPMGMESPTLSPRVIDPDAPDELSSEPLGTDGRFLLVGEDATGRLLGEELSFNSRRIQMAELRSTQL